jgi:hypothetical protein
MTTQPKTKREPMQFTDEVEGRVKSTQWVKLDGRYWVVTTLWSNESGRFEPVSVTIIGEGDRPVLADVLRRLPIGTLQIKVRREARRVSAFPRTPSTAHYIEELGNAHRGIVTTPEEIEQVAAVYLAAWGNGEPVTASVAKAFTISRSTASKRIMKARAAGLLDGATRITR